MTQGYYFLIMELVEHSLEDVEQMFRDNEAKRIEINLSVLDAMKGIHELGYLHRDVKPDNMRVAEDLVTIKFIDFGITALWTDENGNHIPYKDGVKMKGTPVYASLN